MICLFANKSNPKGLFEMSQETIKNRENNLNNKNKGNGRVTSEGDDDDESDDLVDPQLTRHPLLSNGSTHRISSKREVYNAKHLYGKISVEERIYLCDDNLDEEYLEKFTAQLVDLWDKLYKLLSQELSHLKELYTECAKIYRWILERHALIEKVIEFEKKASNAPLSRKTKKILLVKFNDSSYPLLNNN
ncbi:hypothetical protein Glove_352g12 [Diversispora epigaea]|uniref:Uncharacterized protein n=1 Tax=Diversispora epigaea TaxID=1348612 RepID=A0A397HG81_9GLOM|nr:hypothetical protein Glove_352g12 [Diversispora epigaea]